MKTTARFSVSFGLTLGLLAGSGAHAQMPAWEAASYQAPVLADAQAPRKGAALAYPRLSVGLNRVLESQDELSAAATSGFQVAGGRLQVHIEATEEAVPALVAWLKRDGAEHVSSAYHLVQAHVLPSTLRALAAHPDVRAVRKPFYYQPSPAEKEMRARAMAGSMVTEALAAMNVTAWHSAGIRGQGVKVGVIDSGFTNYTSYLGSDLPPANKVFVWSPGTGNMNNTEHGLMCAEIVTDIVPDMDGLYLAAIATEVDIVNATQWMQSQGVKVITMSLGWLSWGPGDGTGILANNINSFVSAGGFWSNSGGNSRLAHWQGNLNVVSAGGQQWADFGGGRIVNPVMRDDLSDCQVIPAGVGISASLIWNQWNAPTTDLDFYIVKLNPNDGLWYELGRSNGDQNGQSGQKPVEEDFNNWVTDTETCYGFMIQYWSGPTNVQMEFFNRFDSNPLLVNIQEGSITPPGDAATATTAAAVNVNSFALKAYSSKGPTNGPGGALTGGFIKPDLAAFADVSCNAYGAGQCGGTSSAAPHIGGAAALVRSGYPSYTGTQIRTYLETNAVDMGSSGKDNDYGTGRLRLGAPPSSSCDTPGVPSNFKSNKSSVAVGEAFQLSWNSAALADSYEVQVADNAGFSNPTSGSTGGTAINVTPNAAGTVYCRVRSKRNCGSMSNWSSTVTVTVTGGGGGGGSYTYWIPVVANLSGSGGSKFYSDLGLLNRGSGTASVELTYYGSGGAIQGTRSESVGANRQRILTNILGLMGKTGKGAMKVSSNQPLTVTSRTYNQATSGTFGQYYDSYVSSQALSTGQSMVLAHLTQNSKYRSNIGVLNIGSGSVTVRITLYSGSSPVGSPFTMTVAAGEYKQEDRVFESKAGQTNVAEGWAKVEVISGSGAIPMASVLDQVTSDPTTIPGKN